MHNLFFNYPRVEVCLAGDTNELNVGEIVNKIPGLRLVITPPTHKMKAIDVIWTTLSQVYKQAEVVYPIKPDTAGKPSDHKVFLFYPINNCNQIRKAEYVFKKVRTMPQSKILSFVDTVTNLNFGDVIEEPDPEKCDTITGKNESSLR